MASVGASPQFKNSQVLLHNMFRFQLLGLYKLVTNFGGEKLGVKFDVHVIESASDFNWNLKISQGKVNKMRLDLPWAYYAQVIEEAIEFCVLVAGRQLVRERVDAVTRSLEKRTEKSFFEISYRLGLHHLKK